MSGLPEMQAFFTMLLINELSIPLTLVAYFSMSLM